MSEAKRVTEGFGKSATKSLRKVTLGLTAMGVAATVAATAIGIKLSRALIRVGRESIKTAVRYDQLERGLTAVAGSSAEAQRQLNRLREVAELPGLSFEAAIQGSTALQAAGLQAELAERSLKAFGNALVTVGKGAGDLKGVNLALTQIVTKQTGFGQELRQLSERLPQVRRAMKDAFGISTVEDFQKLGLTAKEFIEGLVIEFEKLPQVMGTVRNDLENLGIDFGLLEKAIGDTMIDATSDVSKGLSRIVKELTFVVENFDKFHDDIADAFKDIAIIGFRTWSAMLQSMIKITVSSLQFIEAPFIATWKTIGESFQEFVGKQIIKMTSRSAESAEKRIATLRQRTQEEMDGITAEFDRDFTPSFDELLKVLETELTAALSAMTSGISGIEERLKALTKQQRDLQNFKKAISGIADEIGRLFDLFRPDKEVVTPILFDQKEADAALKAIGNFNARSEALRIKDAERIRRSQEKWADIQREEAVELFEFMEGLREDELKRVKARQKEMLLSFQAATSGMRAAFSDFVFQTLSDIDNLGDAWKEFKKAFKAAFLRMVAEILADKAVQFLFKNIEKMQQLTQAPAGGGGSAGGGGFLGSIIRGIGTAAGAIVGNIVAPGIGTGIGAGIGRDIAGSLVPAGAGQPITQINTFNDMSFENMDRNRLQKSAEQDFGPALAEAAVDGR
jgi:tape measure domain-containing protein